MSLKDYVDKYSVEPDFRVSEFNFQTKRTSANAYIPAFIISDINNSVSTAGARNVLNSINATKSKLASCYNASNNTRNFISTP